MNDQTASPVVSLPRCRIPGLALGLLGLAVLAGCQGTQPPSVKHLERTPDESLSVLSQQIDDNARMLTQNQDRLNQTLNRSAPPSNPSLVAPAYDPLEDKIININMTDADVGMFLWALADQLGMNLIVEPEVLQLNKRANLSLKNVTAREVFDNILRAFDLSGKVTGTTLVVGLMDEQIFNVDFVNASMAVDISTGGNVFGSAGGEGGGNQLQGNFSLSGGSGKENDPYEFLEKGVESVLGDQAGQSANAGQDDGLKPAFSLNRVTGGLYVRARPSQVRAIEDMVRYSRSVMGRQVQIEAQLIDVSLSDGFEYGVDWKLLRSKVAGGIGTSPLQLGTGTGTLPGSDNLLSRVLTIPQELLGSSTGSSAGLGYFDDSFSVALTALRSFGDLKVLSNPSIRVRNGAPAMLSVGTTARFVSKTSTTLTNPGGGASTSSADVQTDSLFAGVVFGVIPRIDKDGRVELLIHPMQTDVEPDSLRLVDIGNGNKVTLPVINYKGMTTTLNLKDGDTVLIGGLIDQRVDKANGGIPYLSDIPGLGLLFDRQSESKGSRELVVVLRAQVL